MSRFIRYFREEIILLGIILLALISRLILYSSFSYSNDELSAIFRASYPTFREVVDKGFYVDGHPGGIQVLLFYWMKLVGNSSAAVRIPFVLTGVLAVYVAFLLGRRWFNKATGWYTASCLALLQFPILFSQIARPYGPGLLFSLLMAYTWTGLLFPEKDKTRFGMVLQVLLYSLSFSLCMYTHYFSFLLGLILAGLGLIYVSKEKRYWYLSALLLAAISFIPHIRITLNHLSIKGVGEWLAKPEPGWLWDHILYIFNDSWFVLIIVVFVAGILALLNRKNLKFNRFHIISLVLFLLPFLVGFTYSRFVNPVLQNSVLIFSFPFLVLFLFSFANPGYNRINTVLIIFLNLCLLIDLVFISAYYRQQHFGEFKDVAKTINSWNSKIGIDKITQVIVVNNPWYINFYLDKLEFQGKFVQTDNRGGKDLLELKKILDSSQTPYFLYAWTKPAPKEIEDLILTRYPFIIDQKDYGDLSQVILFGKKCFTGLCREEKPIFRTLLNFDNPDLWEADMEMISTTRFLSPPNSILLDDRHEYGPSYKCARGEINNGKFSTIRISCAAFLPGDSNDVKLVASIESPSGKQKSWAASDFSNYAEPGTWSQVFFTFKLPEGIRNEDIIKIYPWNHGATKVYIDNISIRFFE